MISGPVAKTLATSSRFCSEMVRETAFKESFSIKPNISATSFALASASLRPGFLRNAPIMIFSRTFISLKIRTIWKVRPIPIRQMDSGFLRMIFWPLKVIFPLSAL